MGVVHDVGAGSREQAIPKNDVTPSSTTEREPSNVPTEPPAQATQHAQALVNHTANAQASSSKRKSANSNASGVTKGKGHNRRGHVRQESQLASTQVLTQTHLNEFEALCAGVLPPSFTRAESDDAPHDHAAYDYEYDDEMMAMYRTLAVGGKKRKIPEWSVEIIAKPGRGDFDMATAVFQDGTEHDVPTLCIADLRARRAGGAIPKLARTAKRPAAATGADSLAGAGFTHTVTGSTVRSVVAPQRGRTPLVLLKEKKRMGKKKHRSASALGRWLVQSSAR